MKRIITSILLTLGLSVAMGQNTHVDGKATGLNNQTVTLSRVDGNNLNTIDTLHPDSKGNFSFDVSLDKPALYIIRIAKQKSMIHLMLHPKDKVSVELEYDEPLSFLRLKSAKGSKDVQVYQQFNQTLYNTTKQVQVLDEEYSKEGTSEARKQELSNQFQMLQTNQNIAIRKLIENNSNVLISAFLVTYFENDIDTYYPLYEAVEKGLSKNYADNQFVQYVSQKVKSALGPGHEAPEIAMKDPDGKERKLSDLRGKVVMIDFWASWCRPCRMENPNVVKLYNKYHSKGFEIFSVSLDKKHDDWVAAIEKDGLIWPNHVSDLNGWTSSGGSAYGITSVPNTVLVDRQGRIIAKGLRGEELERKLMEIFGE